ncbi:MAG: phosphodiesterase, partial [Planktomarina sp.]|nr:phosphodiesterase [Planktomarina sp.]
MQLPLSFLTRPIAHRGLHDVQNERPENSSAAIAAAISGGYGIEIDVQLSKDGDAMVFHDYHLNRVTSQNGAIAQKNSEWLSKVTLSGGTDTIATLNQTLAQISGKVPLLIEIKDQDGNLGSNVGQLELKVAQALKTYVGDVAVMSFNP